MPFVTRNEQAELNPPSFLTLEEYERLRERKPDLEEEIANLSGEEETLAVKMTRFYISSM